jgi:hypothetical protein
MWDQSFPQYRIEIQKILNGRGSPGFFAVCMLIELTFETGKKEIGESGNWVKKVSDRLCDRLNCETCDLASSSGTTNFLRSPAK